MVPLQKMALHCIQKVHRPQKVHHIFVVKNIKIEGKQWCRRGGWGRCHLLWLDWGSVP